MPEQPGPKPFAPVQDAQRIILLDVLRGFAVLGILLANIPYMSMAATLTGAFEHHIGGDGWLDYASHHLVFLLADTKFITLFSILFGAGLALMNEKAIWLGESFVPKYLRRLFVLFLFGAAHISLLWFGDILLIYSLIGFVAMWFRNRSVVTLLVWAGIFLVINGVLWALMAMLDLSDMIPLATGPDGEELTLEETLAKQAAEYREVFSAGSFTEMVGTRLEVYVGSGIFMLAFLGMRSLGLFLIGIAIIKSRALSRFTSRRGTLIRTIVIGTIIGMSLQVLALVVSQDLTNEDNRMVYMIGLYVGGLTLALAYAAGFTLWMQTNLWNGLRVRFAAVGRMALTNYISHSLITSILFNHLGYYDQWRRPQLLLLVFGIYAFQMWFSPIWLRHHRFGPLEWIWRVLTYGKMVSMKRR